MQKWTNNQLKTKWLNQTKAVSFNNKCLQKKCNKDFS